MSLRRCASADLRRAPRVVNDAAEAYRGHIPADRWHEPYMPADALERRSSRPAWLLGLGGRQAAAGVMGLQDVRDVALIRHAYVATALNAAGVSAGACSRTSSPQTIAAGARRHLGRGDVGDRLLREARLRARLAGREGPATARRTGRSPSGRSRSRWCLRSAFRPPDKGERIGTKRRGVLPRSQPPAHRSHPFRGARFGAARRTAVA